MAPTGFAALGVQHLDAWAVGNVKAMCLGVCGKVVPAAFSPDLPLCNDAIRTLGNSDRGHTETEKEARWPETPTG